MAKRRPAFERISSDEPAYCGVDLLDALSAQEESAARPQGQAFRRCHNPTTVEELLRLEDFYRLLGRSFAFFQNRKESSDFLIETIVRVAEGTQDFKFYQTHASSWDTILEKIESCSDESERPQILVIDITGTIDVNSLCISIALAEHQRSGIWLRGYIRDLTPRTISLFDALFVFDMSSQEYEILRSAIILPDSAVEQLRKSANYPDFHESVLVFVNYKHLDNAPLLERNPLVLT